MISSCHIRRFALWGLLACNALLRSALVLALVSRIIPEPLESQASFWPEVFLSIGLCMAIGLSVFIEYLVSQTIAIKRVAEMRVRKYEKFLSLPLRKAQKLTRAPIWLSMTSEISIVKNWIVHGLVPLLCYGSWLAVAMVGLTWLDPLLGAWILMLSIALVPLGWLSTKGVSTFQQLAGKSRQRLLAHIQHTFSSISLIHRVNQWRRELRRFERLNRELEQTEIRQARAMALSRGVGEILSFMALLALAWLASLRLSASALTGEQLAVLLMVGVYLLPYVRRLLRVREFWARYRPIASKHQYWLQQPRARQGGLRLDLPIGAPVAVKYQAAGLSKPLVARSGDRVVWQNALGAHAINALAEALRNLEPLRGAELVLDGLAYNKLSRSEISRRIVVIDQPHGLVSGTLAGNICYGARQFSDDDVQDAVLRFDLFDLKRRVERKPIKRIDDLRQALNSLDYLKLELARAYLRKPSVLVLVQTQRWESRAYREYLSQALSQFQCTVIIAMTTGSNPPVTFEAARSGPERPRVDFSSDPVASL